ncbi:hypothetical protein BJ878DRAFT_557550, partial [Calycina marina]
FTSSTCGLQILWSILLSHGTPFLISVGFDGASTAIVWSIAPICGALVQPWFGALSDRCHRHNGQRCSFMIRGCVTTSISLIGFSTSRTQVELLAHHFAGTYSDSTVGAYTKVNCLTWFFLLNVAIQQFQMASRAVIIENNKVFDQLTVNAWASRMQSLGGILGFLLGSIPLSQNLPSNVTTNFTALCLLGIVVLVMSTMISAYFIMGNSDADSETSSENVGGFVNEIAAMPRQFWQILTIQFFAWLEWFPFRTYYTSWLAGYMVYSTNTADFEVDIQDYAARLGSIAGLYFSMVAFTVNCFPPLIITFLDGALKSKANISASWEHPKTSTKAMLLVWLASYLYSAFALLLAGMISSQTGIVLLVSSLGISWAVTLWVPFCLIGILQSRKEATRFNNGVAGNNRPQQLGLVVGLHNAAISISQVLSAIVCSVIFTIWSDTREGILMALIAGGCWKLVASFALWIFFADLQVI